MHSHSHCKITLKRRVMLAHLIAAVVSAVAAQMVGLTLTSLALGMPPWPPLGWALYLGIVGLTAIPVGLLLGSVAGDSLGQRVGRVLETAQAWLRGNLSLRIADPIPDTVGLLGQELNLLAEHLGRDEEDVEELRERNSRLTDQVRVLAVVEERNRLARELHDSVKQQLFSLAMTGSAIRAQMDALSDAPGELREMAQEIETIARAAQQEMTRLIDDLRPRSLQDQGLAEALDDYTLLFGAREHILTHFEMQGNDALLPPSLGESLYRVAQEALHNVARHARATRADVRLRCLPEQVTLTVRDNGIGFDTEQWAAGGAARGLGLANMEERIVQAGGRLTIDSQIGVGTTVTVEVGLTHPPSLQSELVPVKRDRPRATIKNWSWLGQRLVIPVGQTWPWLPADRVHLRRPLVEADVEPTLERDAGFLGLRRRCRLQLGQRHIRIHYGRWGHRWRTGGNSWVVRYVRGQGGRAVLMRNRQPLAAMQLQGRLLNTWTEIVYDGRGYRLSYVKSQPGAYVLVDEGGEEPLTIQGGTPLRLKLCRPLPFPLLVMVAVRVLDESASLPRSNAMNWASNHPEEPSASESNERRP